MIGVMVGFGCGLVFVWWYMWIYLVRLFIGFLVIVGMLVEMVVLVLIRLYLYSGFCGLVVFGMGMVVLMMWLMMLIVVMLGCVEWMSVVMFVMIGVVLLVLC